MKRRKLMLLVVVISLITAVPGTAIEEENQTDYYCCMNCAHYLYTSPDGQTQERWDCLAFSCFSGYLDCYSAPGGVKPCIVMFSCVNW